MTLTKDSAPIEEDGAEQQHRKVRIVTGAGSSPDNQLACSAAPPARPLTEPRTADTRRVLIDALRSPASLSR